MLSRFPLIPAALLALASAAAGQVEFTEGPQKGRLYPRDLATDRAAVRVEGVVHTPNGSFARLVVTRDGAPWWQADAPLQYGPNGAPFAFAPEIEAGLHDYSFELLVSAGGALTSERLVESVACGDAYLIDGQSNANAGGWSQTDRWRSKWIRTWGHAGVTRAQVLLDDNWRIANGVNGNSYGTIGAWALRMGHLLVERYQVPVCIINGSVGATPISWHQRVDENPLDLGTIYGRLLYRAQRAGVADKARAMLWHQGEADGMRRPAYYQSRFDEMRADWLEDYPALEHIFVFQIRKGCGIAGSDMGIREVQRRLADIYPEVVGLPTAGIQGHDGCHYSFEGYRDIGNLAFAAVVRHVFDEPAPPGSQPPNLWQARFTSAARDEIELLFRDPNQPLVLDDGIEEYFVLRGTGSEVVLAADAQPGRILLTLSGPTTAHAIGYVGHQEDGPWVKNAYGVGAFTFQVPIQP